MKRWYLMRHGQTDYNRRRCFYGSHDVSINGQGQADAKQLALLMQEYPVDVIYTSCLKRTLETAQLAFPDREVQAIADFDERGFGQWEGLTADEIEAALDEVNVTRFANYLRRMNQNTQCIVITHRRGTMEEADVLYGVTMQNEGMSKLLELHPFAVEEALKIQET